MKDFVISFNGESPPMIALVPENQVEIRLLEHYIRAEFPKTQSYAGDNFNIYVYLNYEENGMYTFMLHRFFDPYSPNADHQPWLKGQALASTDGCYPSVIVFLPQNAGNCSVYPIAKDTYNSAIGILDLFPPTEGGLHFEYEPDASNTFTAVNDGLLAVKQALDLLQKGGRK